MNNVPNPRRSPEDGPGGLGDYSLGELSHIWRQMDEAQRSYVTMYYERMRKLNEQATAAFKKRGERLQYLLEYCKANKYTDYNTREKILKDWTFNDANDDWLRFSREVRRCQVAIDTELKMAMLLKMVPSAQ